MTVTDVTSPEFAQAAADMLEKERLFDATRPPCPKWCDGECETQLHFGTSITHNSEESTTGCTPFVRHPRDDAALRLWTSRDDELGKPSESLVNLDLTDADLQDDVVSLTPEQARDLAAVLILHAKQGEGR